VFNVTRDISIRFLLLFKVQLMIIANCDLVEESLNQIGRHLVALSSITFKLICMLIHNEVPRV